MRGLKNNRIINRENVFLFLLVLFMETVVVATLWQHCVNNEPAECTGVFDDRMIEDSDIVEVN